MVTKGVCARGLAICVLVGWALTVPGVGMGQEVDRLEPVLRSVELEMVTFEEPLRVGYGEGAVHYTQALAFHLAVDPYVERDIEPFLYVGEAELRVYTIVRTAELFHLTFYAFEPDLLEDEAAIVVTTEHDWMRWVEELPSDYPFRFYRSEIRWSPDLSPDPHEYGEMEVQLLDPRGEPLERLEPGDPLSVRLAGLPSGAPVELFLLDDQGQEWSYARLFADQEGIIDPTLVWYHTGVIGTTDREIGWLPDPAFVTFEEATDYFARHPLRLEARNLSGDLILELEVPVSAERFTPLLYPSTPDGILLNSSEVQRDHLYVTGKDFPAGSTILLLVVPNRYGWSAGDWITDITGPDISQEIDVVRLDDNQTSFTAPVWNADLTRTGAYDLVARIVEHVPDGLQVRPLELQPSDIITSGMDTGVLCYAIINGNIVIESAGRVAGWPAEFEFADVFAQHEPVYAAVDPTDVPATHTGGNYAAYFVVDHKSKAYWDGTTAPGKLVDVSGGPEIKRVKYSCINVSVETVWASPNPSGAVNEYDLIVDFGSVPAQSSSQFLHDYMYNKGTDFIDGYGKVGFYVVDDPATKGSYPVGWNEHYDDAFSTPKDSNDPFDLSSSGFSLVRNWFRIYYPADMSGKGTALPPGTDTYPVALFLHGNHAVCSIGKPCTWQYDVQHYSHNCAGTGKKMIPSHQGYDYILKTLASQGIIAISVDAYDINAMPAGYEARGLLVLEHLNRLKAWNAAGSDPFNGIFKGRIDMSRIGLVGHSRGGEGVVAATEINVSKKSTYGHSISAVVAIAPTDQQAGTRWNIKTAPYLLLAGARDGDVTLQQGFRTYDRAYPTGPAPQYEKCAVWIHGANHNYFNTIWTPNAQLPSPYQHSYDCAEDDGSKWAGAKITAAQQRSIALSTIGGFLRWHLQDVTPYREIFTGRLELPALKNDVLHWSYQDPVRLVVDDFEQGKPGSFATNTLNGGVTLSSGFTHKKETAFGSGGPPSDPCFYHETWGLKLGWNTYSTYESSIPASKKDVSGFTHLAFRISLIPDEGVLNPKGDDENLEVNLVDVDGDKAKWDLDTDDFTDIPYPYKRGMKMIYPTGSPAKLVEDCQCQMKTVRIPLSAFTLNNSGVDLDRIQKLIIKYAGTGLVGIDDIQFTK